MPILSKEVDLFPVNLLEDAQAAAGATGSCWRSIYTRSRHEKQLMRKLVALNIPFYSPLVSRRYRSPQGRVRTSYEPLFPNYVFVYADPSQRYSCLTSNCVSQCQDVVDGDQLAKELRHIQKLIQIGRPVTRESQLFEGDRVRVKSG